MADAFIPTVESVLDELLEGETVTVGANPGSPTPTDPEESNDRASGTSSTLPAGYAAGSISYWWMCDFGSAVEVSRVRVWKPIGAGNYWPGPSGALVEYSDNGTSWTTASTTYSFALVPSGIPSPSTTTEYRYDLVSPLTHRYWRVRQVNSPGLYSGRGMGEWFIDGSSTVGSDVTWIAAPDTIDESDATSDDVDSGAITETTGPFWRYDAGEAISIEGITALLGFETTGSVTLILQGATEADFSDADTVATLNGTATGSLSDDEYAQVFDEQGPYQYWQLILDSAAQDVRVFEVGLTVATDGGGPTVPPGQVPAKAILEIYVHDEDASRWGIATWATGAATGTEGIWSGAGWQDVTPQGVNAHIIWGSRRPDDGILSRQNGATWNVQTYDPDRVLDPGNESSPYFPQLVAGVPIRISHDSMVIRTGYIDRIGYKHKPPDYRGQLLATDTIALLNQAKVPSDSILGDTLLERVQDAINAAGVAVGGIPLPPAGPAGPAIAPLDPLNPRERSVWDHITQATEEVLWVAYVDAAAGLGLRSWGAPLDRGREINAPNLEDLEAVSTEDGLYSVAVVQGSDPDIDPIEREAAPLPRYGRRTIERTELTVDPEAWADAVLQERVWPGVRYVPGTIHCFTRADVDYFGSIEIMERVSITHPGVVSVTGRVLGGEMWVEHRENAERGATWQFKFAVATDGSSEIGLTTLVSDQAGDTLLDDATGTDYLEAD
jgi:hypothetical protein